jgi:phage terminase small subunit
MQIITIILGVIAIGLAILLYLIKRTKKKLNHRESQEVLKKIKGTNKRVESPNESLQHLSKLSKDFFKNYLKIKNEITFKEMAEILKRKNEINLAEFCEKMEIYLYSGRQINKQEVLGIIDQFIAITKTHKIKAIKPEKIKLEKTKEEK